MPVFDTDAAAGISSVKELRWEEKTAYIDDGKIGPVTQRLYDAGIEMQWDGLSDSKGWIIPVCQG